MYRVYRRPILKGEEVARRESFGAAGAGLAGWLDAFDAAPAPAPGLDGAAAEPLAAVGRRFVPRAPGRTYIQVCSLAPLGNFPPPSFLGAHQADLPTEKESSIWVHIFRFFDKSRHIRSIFAENKNSSAELTVSIWQRQGFCRGALAD